MYNILSLSIRAQETAATGEAYICPATDGGYVMLSVPRVIPVGVFDGVEWSSHNTCISQIQALRRIGMTVRVGHTFHDIDESEDLGKLVVMAHLSSTSAWIQQQCKRTLNVFKELCPFEYDQNMRFSIHAS